MVDQGRPMKVVSTKLSEEEHTKLLDTCNSKGCTPSSMIRDAILNQMDVYKNKSEEPVQEEVRKVSNEELKQLLGIRLKKNSL